MAVPAAYLGVILIWMTTPLAIKWSGEGSHFMFAVTARMFIGAGLSLALVWLTRTSLPLHRKARMTYLAVGFGVYGAMTLCYWGAQFIPSGLISVIFGLSPNMTGVLAALFLGEKNLTPVKLSGMILGLLGLATVFQDGAEIGSRASHGIAAVLIAMLIHCCSAVWVKKVAANIPALASTAGGVTVATLLLAITWIVFDMQWPVEVTPRAFWSIIYLGMAGSVVGFSLYYYLLKHVEATRVALITLITPVLALVLGNVLNGEELSLEIVLGTGIILLGLLLFLFGEKLVRRFNLIEFIHGKGS